MKLGSVKWYDPAKGYGFIIPDDSPRDEDNAFVHVSELKRAGIEKLNAGDRVEYETKRTDRSFAAKDLRLLPAPAGSTLIPNTDSGSAP